MIVAFDGNQALEMVRRDHPDLLATDVNMPGMDGLNLLETIRAESLMTRSAIVLTSRCDQEEIEARAGILGAVVHPKPFSPQRLMEAIESALTTESHMPGPPVAAGDFASAEHD